MLKAHEKTPLFSALKEHSKSDIVPFDVPGHKRGRGLKEFAEYFGSKILEMDVNSMKSLDNISNPIGVIKEAEELMAEAYGANHAFFLVNGTSSGLHAMIMSTCQQGDKIILPRNVHKSAINALILSGAIPVYIHPEKNSRLGISMGVSLENIEKAIAENPDAKAILLINPTYYGFSSDLKNIIKLAHKHGMAALLDEAHGAHFKFHPELPISGIEFGADIAAVSIHKTGGSLTQSSVLLLNEGYVDKKTVKTVLNLLQSTSASYLLMSSLDVARKNLVLNGREKFDEILDLVRKYRSKLNEIDGLYAFGKELVSTPGAYDFDETKLGVCVSGIGLTGFEVYDLLRDEYKIQVELADTYNILAIVSIGDNEENLLKLYEGLKDISIKYRKKSLKHIDLVLDDPEVIVSPRNAFYARKKVLPLDEVVGEISGESIMAYPPGIPIITPGERISQEIVNYIKFLKKEKTMLTDSEDPYVNSIKVLGF